MFLLNKYSTRHCAGQIFCIGVKKTTETNLVLKYQIRTGCRKLFEKAGSDCADQPALGGEKNKIK